MIGIALPLGQAMAAEFTVTVKNLTNGIYFTPLLITAHDRDTHLFETGSPASPALQAMAEGGDISGLIRMVGGEDQDTVANSLTHIGLKSRFANRSRYAPREKTLSQVNRWLIKRYLAYAAEYDDKYRSLPRAV